MAITYLSQGSGVSTETSGAALSPLCPATVNAGDILIAHAFYEGTVTTPSTPSGWTLLDGPRVIESTIARHWVFGKVADGTEDGAAVAFGSPAVTTQRGARVYSFAGRTGGTITELVTGFAATSHATDPQMPSVTTAMAGALAVALVGQNDNNAQAAPTGETGGDWIEAVAEYTAALTPGLALAIETATPTGDPGTISGGTIATANDPCGVIGFNISHNANKVVTPPTLALTITRYAPGVNLVVIPPVAALATTRFAPVVGLSVIPPVRSLTTSTFAPVIALGVIPPTKAIATTTFAPTVTVGGGSVTVTPPTVALTIARFAPAVNLAVIPPVVALSTTRFAPVVGLGIIPGTLALATTRFAPVVALGVIPPTRAIATTTFAPTVTATQNVVVTPPTRALTITTYAPTVTATGGTTPDYYKSACAFGMIGGRRRGPRY